jgi:zinc protease
MYSDFRSFVQYSGGGRMREGGRHLRRLRWTAVGWGLACLVLLSLAKAQAPDKPAAEMPTVDQILSRNLAAEGGRGAFEKITSRVMIGTIRVPSMSLNGTVELREKAPDRSLAIITINGASYRQGFDGTSGWTDDPRNGLRDQTGAELAEMRREADFYHTLDMRKLYAKFTLTGKQEIGGRDAYVIEAALPEGGPPETMYFDAASGLLVRDTSRRHGPDGASEFQQDYEDYQEIDGIQLPRTIRQINEGTVVIITVAEYHHNVPLEDGEFAKPAAP